MANEILIQFKADGHERLINAINKLASAKSKLEKGTRKVTAASSKLNSTTLSLTAKLGAQNKTWRDLGVSTRTVSQAMRGNQVAVEKLKNSYNKFNTTTRVLGGSFAVIRSKMLLASFAATLVSQSVLKLVKLFGEQELAERRLSIALGRTSKALLNQATALQKVTTFGDEAIIGVQTSIAAFIKDEDQIKLATEATLDLAAAKGMDLKTASDLVAKSIGSSTNSLSRYGIEADGSAGSTERLESVVNNIKKLYGGFAEGELKTTIGQLRATANAVGDAGEAFGKVLAPVVLVVAKGMKVLAESINPARIRAYTVAMVGLSIATGHFGKALAWVNVQLQVMRARLIKSGLGIAILAIGELSYQMGLFGGSTDDATDEVEEQIEALRKLDEAILDNIKSMEKQLALLKIERDSIGQTDDEILIYIETKKKQVELGRKLTHEERKLVKQIFLVNKEIVEGNVKLREHNSLVKESKKRQEDYAKELERTRKKINNYNQSIVGLSTTLTNLERQHVKLRGHNVSDIILSPDELAKYQSRLTFLSKITQEAGFDLEHMFDEDLKKTFKDDGVSLAHAFAMGWESQEEYVAGKFDELLNVYGGFHSNRDLVETMAREQEIIESIMDAESRLANAKDLATANEEKRKNTASLILALAEQNRLELQIIDNSILADDLRDAGRKFSKEDLEMERARLQLLYRRENAENAEHLLLDAKTKIEKKVTDGVITYAEAQEELWYIMSQQTEVNLELLDIADREIELLEIQRRKTEALTKARDDAYASGIKNSLQLASALSKNEKEQKDIAFALAMVDAVRVGVGTYKNLTDAGMPVPIPGILAAIEFAAATAMANNIRKFEQGGVVGGRRHSQGGTLIEAEQGEFVMSRRAVESIGVNNLSRMNQGGGAINVNVTGNVLSSDFVEGELADKISEAVRKGVDFGIS